MVWSDFSAYGDLKNYQGLPVVTTLEDLQGVDFGSESGRSQAAALTWATQNTCAFNGAPNAWNVLNSLVD